MAEASHEKIVADLAKDIDRNDLSTLVFDLEKYQVYDPEAATVAFAYITGQLGVVFWNLEPGDWRRVVDVHLSGTFFCCRHAAPRMVARGSGAIVNTSSH